MADELKKVRKGTGSCTECRRRKVRCTWSSDEAPKCRRCEERGSNCIAQIYSLQSSSHKRITSRDRIARLEQQVNNLHKALRTGGSNTDQHAAVDIPSTEPDLEPESDDSLSSSNLSDEFTRDPPAHLTQLFENDLISSNNETQNAHQSHQGKVLSDLSAAVRNKLQELIPPKQEVEFLSQFASHWLSLFHALFPAPSVIKSGEEIVMRYEDIGSRSVDPAYLASWLLSLAMTIQMVPKDKLQLRQDLKGIHNPTQFSKTISDTVEATIIRHDALLGTLHGIDAGLLFLRVQLSRGNFKKTWLQLRRIIAVAELIGLHRAARRSDSTYTTAQDGNVWPDTPEASTARKAQIWESICSVDRIAGMMFNLPPGTRRYRVPQHLNIVDNGKVSLRAYLGSLSEIAMKVQDFDDLDMPHNPDSELYATVLKIDGELRVLASVVPAAWWSNPDHLSDQLMQYWHYYITVRVHLPFTLRHDTGEQFGFSRLACMKACQTVAQRYRVLRPLLPRGFFVLRVVDLQAFTALVVICLAYHASSPAEKASLRAQGVQPPDTLVPDVLDSMRAVLNDKVSDLARQAVSAVTALMQLLEDDSTNNQDGDLKLKVPLLGKLHIRRKRHDRAQEYYPQQILTAGTGTNDVSQTNSSVNSSVITPNSSNANNNMAGAASNDYYWDPLSWSIEDDQAGVFQDALMAEDFSPLGSWWDQNIMDFTSQPQ